MKRYFMAFIGVVFIGFSVAVLNLSGFGVDPFSCMNMSVSAYLPFSFGVWQIFVIIPENVIAGPAHGAIIHPLEAKAAQYTA